jgi:heptosyltransferase-1
MTQLIALLRRVSLMIAGDTGPLHLAAALGRPVLALFGPTDPARTGPYGTRSIVLRHATSSVDHRRHAEPEAGLKRITVDEVVAGAQQLLAAAQGDAA